MEDGNLTFLGDADSQDRIGSARKANREALPALPQDQPETMSAVEELLVDIWTEMLGATRVGVRDNFFDLGGHSLVALRIISRVNDHFQIEMSVRTLLEHPVLREFAQEVFSISKRSEEEVEKIAKIGLMVRRMTPEQRKAALSVH
jgi:acyl carrier protein